MSIVTIGMATDVWAAETEDLVWNNNGVELHGTLHLPDGRGPHPVFVLLHGSGPEDRGAFTARRYVQQFVQHDIAMLHYDKRGAGESTGDWMVSDYEDLARDAVAGIELIAARPDVDAGAIGVIGFSEGGWTGPLTATISEHVSLLILVSGPPMSPLEQGIYELEVAMRDKGASPDQIAQAVALERHRLRVMQTDTGWDQLDKAIAAAQSQHWYELAGRPGRPDRSRPRSQWYARVMNYDPIPVLQRLKIPALMLFGAEDPVVDAKRSVEILQGLAANENKDFTIHVYPHSKHNLTSNGITFPDDHWDRIFAWIDAYWPERKPHDSNR